MMNQKTLAIGVVVLMAIAIGFLLKNEQTPQSTDKRLFPDLKASLGSVESLQIRSLADQSEITVKRQAGRWVVEEKGDYPADFEAVSGFLTQLAELEIAETKTARADNHQLLQLADTGEQAGTLVVVSPGDTALIVGKQGVRGSFVRRQGEAQVYLTDKVVTVSGDVLSWVDPVVINLDPGEVSEVTIATREANYLRAVRDPASGSLRVENLPEGRTLKYESVVDALGRALVNLRLLDVMPFDPDLFSDPSRLRITTTSGEVINVTSVEVAEKFFAHLDTDDRRQWQYEISQYNYDELNKTMEDLLTPLADDDE